MAINYGGHNSALKMLFEDRCTVTIEEGTALDEITQETVPGVKVLYFDIPCRVSFYRSKTLNMGMHDASEQDVMLFVDSDVDIPSGSTIKVSRAGTVLHYSRLGLPNVYQSHREYPVEAIEVVR